MVSGMISYNLPRMMTSVYVSGRPSSLPLQMSADILKNMSVLPSGPTGS